MNFNPEQILILIKKIDELEESIKNMDRCLKSILKEQAILKNRVDCLYE